MKILMIAVLALLTACTSLPYHPPVVVKDSQAFVDRQWAVDTINVIAQAADRSAPPGAIETPLNAPGLEIVTATSQVPAGTLRFSAFIWSPLTAPAKQLLAYDLTGTPTDCASAAECKPVRARLNGTVKDRLLDDCLSDAIIYEGAAKESINAAFIDAITAIVAQQTHSTLLHSRF
jgi:hypothetical protein